MPTEGRGKGPEKVLLHYNTTRNLMIGVAVLAFLLAISLSRSLMESVVWLAAVAVGLLLPMIAVYGWIEFIMGSACPWCRERLQIASVRSFGHRYYRCPSCEARLRRGKISALGGWEDASGPEYDSYFEKRPKENPWTLPPELLDEAEVGEYSKTHGSLLRNKRRRNPNSPNWPLPPGA